MNGQQLRTLLQAMIGLFGIGTPAVLAWAILVPVHPPRESSTELIPETEVADAKLTAAPHVPGLEEFGMLVYKPLQQQLVTDEAGLLGQRQVVLKVAVPPPVKLLATVIESDRSAALFETGDGVLKWCRLGESPSEDTTMEVVAIEPAKVVIRYLGQESTLKISTASDG